MNTLVIASHNLGKVKEFQDLLSDLGIIVKSLKDYPDFKEIEETGETFMENALLKAKAVAEFTGHLSLADDSGLVVYYLDGAPGIYSARYAGVEKNDDKNNLKLLHEMRFAFNRDRDAQFECAIALCDKNGYQKIVSGILEGSILHSPRGNNGFGYDSLFYIEELQKTTAELTLEEKNKISHRGKATKEAIAFIRGYFEQI